MFLFFVREMPPGCQYVPTLILISIKVTVAPVVFTSVDGATNTKKSVYQLI